MLWETGTATQISRPRPPRGYLWDQQIVCILTRLSHFVRQRLPSKGSPSDHRVYSQFYQGITLPPSSQRTEAPYKISSYSSLDSCHFPTSHQYSLTHLSPSAQPLSPDQHAVAITSAPQPQTISNPDDLDFSFPPATESPSCLWTAQPRPHMTLLGAVVSQPPLTSNLTRVLTVRDVVLQELPLSGPLSFNLPPSGPITVSGSVVSSSVIHLRHLVGCDTT